MRYEDMPTLPLATNGRAELLELTRAAVTQCELMPGTEYSDEAGTASAEHATALAGFFTAIATKFAAIAEAKAPEETEGEE